MTQAAIDRLLVSRERLRQALQGAAPPSSTADRTAAPGESPLRTGLKLALVALRLAWQRHPWRNSTALAHDVATRLLAPQAAQHPLRLVTVAAVAGALLMALRPWRWLGPPVLLAAIEPLLREGVIAALASAAALPAGAG